VTRVRSSSSTTTGALTQAPQHAHTCWQQWALQRAGSAVPLQCFHRHADVVLPAKRAQQRSLQGSLRFPQARKRVLPCLQCCLRDANSEKIGTARARQCRLCAAIRSRLRTGCIRTSSMHPLMSCDCSTNVEGATSACHAETSAVTWALAAAVLGMTQRHGARRWQGAGSSSVAPAHHNSASHTHTT
jgi:hypothetical protein